jgi:hypothetical protein
MFRSGSETSARRHRGRRPFTGKQFAVIVATFAVVVGLPVAASAVIPNGNTYNACAAKKNGALRAIDTSKHQKCASTETKVSWSKAGTPGPKGATGANGANGANGPSGVVGMETFDPNGGTNTGSIQFLGTPLLETFDAKTAAHLTATVDLASDDGGNAYSFFGICYEPVGGSAPVSVADVEPEFTAPAGSFFAQTVNGIVKGLAPGNYNIGACTQFETANMDHGDTSGTAIIAETR